MQDSWSFDGSIVSLSESIGPSNNASALPLRPDDDSAVSARDETDNRVTSAVAPPETSGEPALAFSAARIGDMSKAAPPAERDERDRGCGPTSTVPPHATFHLAGASTAPTGFSSEAIVGQTISRGRPGVRAPGGGGGGDATAAVTRSTSVSSTTSTDGSAASSSLPSSSTKMSDAEITSEQEGAGTSAFVMPSLNMGGGITTAAGHRPSPPTTEHSSVPDEAAATSQRLRRSWSEADRVRILMLGSTADDRRTFAKLVSLDDDDEDRSRNRVQSSASSEGVTDMSFSFLSTRPAPSNHGTESSGPLPQPRNDDETFEALSPRAGSATLFQLTDDELSTAHLLDKLQMPFERLEAKISRTYPATDRLADLVSSASCESFDACLFLFSSPPTAREVALARPVSRLVPLFPALLLPPPPSGKSQKTNALCHAVQEQLNGADVRWLPAESISRRRGPSGSGGGGCGPLFMLPHDLFAQQPPPVLDPYPGPCGDSPPFSAPLSSRDSPNSLASSQELFALPPSPHSPALTAMSSAPPSSIGTGEERPGRHGARQESGGGGGVRSLLASGPPSTRAGSPASRSDSRRRSSQPRRRRGHRGGGCDSSSTGGGGGSSSESDSMSDSRHMYGSSTSLADLKRLQFILHDPSLLDTLQQLAARVFLEWREVEIAAVAAASGSSRDFSTAEPRANLPLEWKETLLEDERGACQHTGTNGTRINARKGLDFSRRVAERRQALRASAAPPPSRGVSNFEQSQTQEDEAVGAPISASTTRESTISSAYWTDPTTPRCIQRGLPSFASGTVDATARDRTDGEGYSPSTSNASVPWLDSAIEFASSSTEEVQQPTTAPRPLSPTSLVYLLPADPFHLPSLIHLVGLNLRLAFDPAAALGRSATVSAAVDEDTAAEGTKSSSTSTWSWWRTAATVGLVFAAGVAIGAHVISKRTFLYGSPPTLAAAAVIASPADWASWSPAVMIRS